MIVYKNIIRKLYDAGYTNKFLRDNKLLSQSVLTSIRKSKHITTDSVNTICILLGCQPNDIMEVVYQGDLADECMEDMKKIMEEKRKEAALLADGEAPGPEAKGAAAGKGSGKGKKEGT